ncbi:MAG TPA: TrkA C-terminal domain-containing protein [Actinomycetota bacterium]|nr:TrkA C-terminal domain-containing protein [Actinomycetota bacterium]
MSDADDQPRNVKDLLVEAKDASELMVDLAYAAVFFNDEDLAEEVESLERRLYGYLRRLRQFAILAGRSPEDAEQMSDVLWIAGAIEKIGDAASDIARVVAARLGIPDALRKDLRHADEIIGRVRVRDDAPCIGRSLRDLRLPSETGMWLMAVRRGDEWVFDPDADTVLSAGDVLLYHGPEDGVNLLREVVGAPPLPEPPDEEIPPLTELDRAVDLLVEMKNSAEVAVGLAYSSLLLQNRSLAAEVGALEARSDILHDELESWVLKAAPEARNTDELRGLLRLAYASEQIFDAARDMTWSVEQGEELHPVIQLALEETEEVTAEALVEDGARAVGRSLKDLQVETETGMFILAVQRGRRWIYRPRPRFEFEAGDRLIAIGPEEGEAELEALTRAPAPVVGAS